LFGSASSHHWTLKNQIGLERHGGRVPAGLWGKHLRPAAAALNAAIWFKLADRRTGQAVLIRIRSLSCPSPVNDLRVAKTAPTPATGGPPYAWADCWPSAEELDEAVRILRVPGRGQTCGPPGR